MCAGIAPHANYSRSEPPPEAGHVCLLLPYIGWLGAAQFRVTWYYQPGGDLEGIVYTHPKVGRAGGEYDPVSSDELAVCREGHVH